MKIPVKISLQSSKNRSMKKKKKRSFMRRISWNMLILILVSNLVTYVFAYMFFYHTIYENTKSSGENMLIANLQVLDQYFRQIDQIADAIIYNESLNNMLKSETDTSSNMQMLKSIEQIYYHSRSDLQLTFYKEKSPRYAYSIYTNTYYSMIVNFKTSFWYQQLHESGEKKILLTNIHSEGELSSGDFVHSMIYRIDDLYSNRVVGYLRIDMDLAKLQEQLMLNYIGVEGVEIVSKDGEVLFYTGEKMEMPKESFSENISGGIREISTGKSFIYCGISEKTGWIVAISISKRGLYQQSIIIGFLLLTILLLTLAVCLTVVDKNSVILNQNMLRLTEGMNAMKRGELEIQVNPSADDEIERVIVKFNEMAAQIRELVGKIEAKQALLSEAQIKALQQQINPHFIYNSMETLMGMASEGQNQEIIEICKCISAMLRYNTRMAGNSTIKDELMQVQNYTKVMAMRMGGSFEPRYAVDPECLDAKIVKFSLQPLMENAIGHGMDNRANGGLVYVSAKKDGTEVEIRIMDNGCGISPAKLRRLQEQMAAENENYLKMMENSSNTGLLNVHLRLKLYFGKEYSMTIRSEMGEGTDIRIRIPYWKEEKHVSSHDCG